MELTFQEVTKKLIFQESTNTIRQMPENYIIAEKIQSRWVCDPDAAADKGLVLKMVIALFSHGEKYGDGDLLAHNINNTSDVISVKTHDRAIRCFYGRACNCDICTDEISTTLDILLDCDHVPKCPVCDLEFELVSIVDLINIKNLSGFENNT